MIKKKSFSIFIAILLMLCSSIILCFYSKWSYKIYNYPRCESGVIAFDDDTSVTKNLMLHPLGEIEFYYNRWIISDNDSNPADSYIRIPSKWSDSLNNNTSFPKKGYASYKLTLKNLTPYSTLLINPETTTIASYYYFNGVYVGQIGNPSKTNYSKASELKESSIISYTVPKNGIVEFVIECGYNPYGGLHTIPPIQFDNYDPSYSNFVAYIFGISFGVIIFVIIIGIIFSKNKKFLLLPTLVLTLIHYSVSYDSLILLRRLGIYLDYNIIFYISYLTGCLLIISMFYYLVKRKYIKFNIKYYLPILGLILCTMATYHILMFTGYNLIHILLVSILVIIGIIFIFKHIITSDKINIEFFIFFTIIGTLLVQTIDYLDIVKVSCYGFVSVSIISASIIALCVYIYEIINLYKNEKIKNEIEIKNLKYQQEILLKQIKPHLIYNSLASIQNLYHKNIDEGDKGIITFSKYLRTNVDSINSDLVLFSEEIDNIINYVDLQNLSLENKFNLILDIDYEDFFIPLLSLQPIIENSIKYSGVNEKKDGYIKIQSFLENNIITIIISNNGIPFDTSNISLKSKGLANIKERLKLFLNAEFEMTSNTNETKTIIKFNNEVNNNEGNNS